MANSVPPADFSLTSRLAAIDAMPDGAPLRQLAGLSGAGRVGSNDAEAVQRAARVKMAQLIDDGAIDLASLMAEAPDPLAALSLVSLCKQAARLPSALAGITDPLLLVALVTSGASSRLRQLAAATIEDPLQLHGLIRQVRDRDKGVYKILKQKADALLTVERRRTELEAEINAAAAALQRHGQLPFDSTYESRFERLAVRWQSLAEKPTQELRQRMDDIIERCRRTVADHREQLLRLQLEQAAALSEQAAAKQAQELQRQEMDMAELALREARDQAQRQAAAELAAARAAEQAALAASRSADQALHGQMDGLLRKVGAALNDGDTKRASVLRRSLGDIVSTAPTLPQPILRQLQQVDAKLQELKRWKDFAVGPKRAELIADMESLIGSAEEPSLLAERIRSLQDDWRTVSKGIVGDAPADTDRFQRASQLAFQPCRQYFEAQANLRRENLQRRKAVLERLTGFAATQTAEDLDWRLVSQALREAPQEWRRSFPVDRDAGRALQKGFDACIDRLRSLLAAWYERNVAEKQALIAQGRELLERIDNRENRDAVKHLQARWKDTQPAPRDLDRSLWAEFRGVCDEVYKKRQQAHANYLGNLDVNKSKAVTLCEDVECSATLTGSELAAAVARIPQWRAGWAVAGELPRADGRHLEQRFERAIEGCKAQLAKQRSLDAARAEADIVEAGRLVRACEWAAASGAPESQRSLLKEAAAAILSRAANWPKGTLPVLHEALAAAESTTLEGIAVREKALRLSCIQCEILTGMTTPNEDQTLRREYQVQRLVQGMGQGHRGEEASAHSEMLAWLRIAAISPDTHARLQERFMQCIKRMNQRQPTIG